MSKFLECGLIFPGHQAIAGTRADPHLSGTLAADDLALRSVVDGFEMQGGRLRASVSGQRVQIDEFSLRGPGPDGGEVTATGEAVWTPSGLQLRMNAQAQRLRASTRSDRQVTVSGMLTARRDAAGTAIDGKLKVDQALIVLPDEGTPKLGTDVVVRGAPVPLTRGAARADEAVRAGDQPLQVAVDVDLGDNFRVRGMGIDTQLEGTVTVSAQSLTMPRLAGTIRTRGGQYRAYGQRLDIERGVIRFTGPADNPALDILAVRPNLPQQRVGVQITGTALVPRVQLYADPDLPDAEKLAWLVTGRAAPEGGAESALLQEAALVLLSKRTGGPQGGIASAFGLDELSVRREGTEGAAVTLGKRIGSKLYAAYERSLSGAVGTLSLFYDVSRRLTVRAQTVLAQGREIMLAGDALRDALAAQAQSRGARAADDARSALQQASDELARYADDIAANPPDAHAPRRLEVAAQPLEEADRPLVDATNELWRQIAGLPDWRAEVVFKAPASEAIRT